MVASFLVTLINSRLGLVQPELNVAGFPSSISTGCPLQACPENTQPPATDMMVAIRTQGSLVLRFIRFSFNRTR
jgi:hypothetical protein